MRVRRIYYGWLDPKDSTYRVSLYPADAPVRPSISFESVAEAIAMVERRRATILWWPPLPNERIAS